MKKNLIKFFGWNQYNNIKISSFATSIQVIIQIIFPPIMLIIWGAENYGRWIYLLAAISLINIILLQITDVVRFEITNAFANKKYKYPCKYYHQYNIIQVMENPRKLFMLPIKRKTMLIKVNKLLLR